MQEGKSYSSSTQRKRRILTRCELNGHWQSNGFPKVPIVSGKAKAEGRVRNWRIQAVYSTEVQQKTMIKGIEHTDGTSNVNDVPSSSFRTCDGPLGTASFVTASYGFAAAWKVVEMIASDKLVVPKKQGKRIQKRATSKYDMMELRSER